MKSKKLATCLLALGAVSMLTLGSCGNNPSEEPTSNTPTSEVVPSVTTPSSSVNIGEVKWEGLDKPLFHAGSVESFDLLKGVTAKAEDGTPLEVVVKDDGGFDCEYPSDYYVTYAAKLDGKEVATAERCISVQSSLDIINGDFSDENLDDSFLTEKKGFLPGGGIATREVVDGALKVVITKPGNESWNLQLKYTKPLDFIKGHTYEFSFKFKGDGHTVSGGAENAGLGMLYKGFMPVKSTAEWQTYTQYLDINDNLTGVLPVVTMGYGIDSDACDAEHPHTLYIDDLKLIDVTDKVNNKGVTWENAEDVTAKGGKLAFDQLPGVVAKDAKGNVIPADKIEEVGELPETVLASSALQKSYRIHHEDGSISYINRKVQCNVAKDNPYGLVNDDFSLGSKFWTCEDAGTNTVKWAAKDGEVSATFGEDIPTDNNWKIQLWQGDITWEKGYTYYVTYRVKASKVGMHLHTEINNNAGWKYSHTDYVFEKADEYVDYKVGPFYIDETVEHWARISNLLGYNENKGGTITWDSIKVSRVEGDQSGEPKREAPHKLMNEKFDYGLDYWTFEANDPNWGGKATAENGEVKVKFNDTLGGNVNWKMQIFQVAPHEKLEVGKTYVASWVAKADREGMCFFSELFQTQCVKHDLTTEYKTYTQEITITENFNFQLGRVSTLLGEKCNEGGTITFDSISFDLKA